MVHTMEKYIYEAIIRMLKEWGIYLKKVVLMATDGAPVMMDREREETERSPSWPDLMTV